MTVTPERIDEIVAAIEKNYGESAIHRGSETQRAPRIPFPSISLNIATGGGIPLGRISRLYGQWSSGKTLVMLRTIGIAQSLNLVAEQMLESEYEIVRKRGDFLLQTFPNGLEVAYYNVEKVFDKEYAESLGVDVDRLYVVEGTEIEKIGTIVEGSLDAIHMHVIDTCSAAMSIDEVNSDIEDWHRAIKARAWGKVQDHVLNRLNIENAVVLIDQIRVDQMTGADKPPGGKMMEHNSAQTIQFKRGKWLYRRSGALKPEMPQTGETIHGKAEADGQEVLARVVKSRVGRPLREARMQLDFDTMNFDRNQELAKAAVWFGIADRSGSWYTLGEKKVQGEGGLKELISEDVDLQKQIQDQVNKYIEENP